MAYLVCYSGNSVRIVTFNLRSYAAGKNDIGAFNHFVCTLFLIWKIQIAVRKQRSFVSLWFFIRYFRRSVWFKWTTFSGVWRFEKMVRQAFSSYIASLFPSG